MFYPFKLVTVRVVILDICQQKRHGWCRQIRAKYDGELNMINDNWCLYTGITRDVLYVIPFSFKRFPYRREGDKPLSEPMMVNLLTHICVARPQWVNTCVTGHATPVVIAGTTILVPCLEVKSLQLIRRSDHLRVLDLLKWLQWIN